jgi:hypothetical protein
VVLFAPQPLLLLPLLLSSFFRDHASGPFFVVRAPAVLILLRLLPSSALPSLMAFSGVKHSCGLRPLAIYLWFGWEFLYRILSIHFQLNEYHLFGYQRLKEYAFRMFSV